MKLHDTSELGRKKKLQSFSGLIILIIVIRTDGERKSGGSHA